MVGQSQSHALHNVGWLRAAVLGANDGILSTASLIAGVAASSASEGTILVAGLAGLVAGAMSMAAGEYVSVSSQSDAEEAALARKGGEIARAPREQLDRLAGIYVARGVTPELALQVATQMTAKDALSTHARDELGITEHSAARPVLAALSSAASFSVGGAVPLVAAILSPVEHIGWIVTIASLVCLGLLGAFGAKVGDADVAKPTGRILLWGALAMALTSAIGRLTGEVF